MSVGGFIWQDEVKTSESEAVDGGRIDISKAVLRAESPAETMYMGQPMPRCGRFLPAKRQSTELVLYNKS